LESDLQFTGGKSHRTFEAGRPACGEQLLGIGADARGAGRRKLDVETAVGTARRAIAAAGGVGLGCVQYFVDLGHRVFLFELSHDGFEKTFGDNADQL
jgi:hypothetical protein